VLGPNLLQTYSPSNNWCWWPYLILNSLVCNTFTWSTCHILVPIIIIGGMLCLTLCSFLVWYIASVTKVCFSKSLIYNTISTYCGNIYSTLLLSRSSSHSSWLCQYWDETDCQVGAFVYGLFPYLHVFFNTYVVSPQICTKCHVFGLTHSFLFFPIPYVIDL
jgi:hypothetical protein